MDNFILESCVDSVESAVRATQGGANRLELCSNLMIGGTTPTKALYETVREYCNNRIHVLIRPRFGDFCYSSYEYSVILKEVEQFRELGAQGVVIGILKPDGTIDKPRMKELMEAAGEMSITLHRAFDVCAQPYQALEEAAELGVQTILTSGQKNSSMEGRECIRELVARSGGRVDILVGSGVNSQNISRLYADTGATSYHMSGKEVLDSNMVYRKEDVHMGLDSISEYDIWRTDEDEIRRAHEVLRNL